MEVMDAMRYSRVCLPAQLGEPGFETAACGVLQGLGILGAQQVMLA